MTPKDEKFERIAQRHIADLKKSSKSIVEDATVRAVQKVMAEFAQGAHTEAKVEYHATMIQCPHCDGSVRVPAQPYPDNFIDALKYDVAKRDSEFFTHSVEQPYDWSEWVCPDPKGYLMKCCDCGLVHEAEFGVVRYKSETEREDCDMVDDPNLQAVFRMRRSEQWSPLDTAHRAGGLPMEQPAQDNTYNYAKNLAEAMFKRHFASDEHYASGRIVWGVNDTVIGILTQIDNMVADMVRRPAQQTCNCRWEGDTQVQQCTLHKAHVDAIHEWAERAKAAEAELKEQPAQQYKATSDHRLMEMPKQEPTFAWQPSEPTD